MDESGAGAGSELRWNSGHIAVVPRVLFKELFAPGIFRVPLVPPPLRCVLAARGCRRFLRDRVSPSRRSRIRSAAVPRARCDLCCRGSWHLLRCAKAFPASVVNTRAASFSGVAPANNLHLSKFKLTFAIDLTEAQIRAWFHA